MAPADTTVDAEAVIARLSARIGILEVEVAKQAVYAETLARRLRAAEAARAPTDDLLATLGAALPAPPDPGQEGAS